MAPHAENQKVCSSKNEKKKLEDELLEKLKLEEEKEKKKLEKEAKRRAELEKIKNESFMRQADLLAPLKKEKHTVQPKKAIMKSQQKASNSRKPQSHKSENKNSQGSSYEKKSSGNKNQSLQSRSRYPHNGSSSSSEYSWKRDDCSNYRSNPKHASFSNCLWGDTDEHFPMLGAEAPVPQVNVWEERKYKCEEIKALQPRNEYDEEAMLQQALALSLMEATEEEERKQKLEEEYRLQTAALKHNPEMLEKFNDSEDFIVADKSALESHSVLKCVQDQNPEQCFSRNVAMSSLGTKDKTSKSGGARPKINKIIDTFGGWGLKDTQKEKHSAPLSEFVDDIVNEKSSRKYSPASGFPADAFKNIQKSSGSSGNAKKLKEHVDHQLLSDTEIKEPVGSDSWSATFSNDDDKSSVSDPWKTEVLYDREGTLADVDGAKLNTVSSTTVCCDISSKEKESEIFKEERSNDFHDKWLNYEDESSRVSDGWDNDIISNKKTTGTGNVERDFVGYTGSVPSNNVVIKHEKSASSISNFKPVTSEKENKSVSNFNTEYESVDISVKPIKATGTSSVIHRYKKQNKFSSADILSQFESTYRYIVDDTSESKDVPSHSQTLPNNDDIWSDGSSNKSISSNSVPNNQNENDFVQEKELNKFISVEDRNPGAMTLNSEIDVPPILPPQPATKVPEVNELSQAFTAEVPGDGFSEDSPHILPPQASSAIPSQYLINPMFPGVNPIFGLGMDPITVRQMLMLSNPFFASQLLAMEQYYRALGMPVDLFSFPNQTVPNMPFPGLMNTSVEQNTFPNTINSGASSRDSHLQNHYQDQTGNQSNSSVEQHLTKYPTCVDEDFAAVRNQSILENAEADPWYNKLPSESTSAIPPPKAPILENNDQTYSLSEPSETSGCSSSYNNISAKQHVSSSSESPYSDSINGASHKPFTAMEACISKTEATGWGDLEDESFNNCKSKTNTWDDDGWGTDNLPAKSIKNPSVYEDNKKVIHRQPARQPQLGRFQRNRRFN